MNISIHLILKTFYLFVFFHYEDKYYNTLTYFFKNHVSDGMLDVSELAFSKQLM